MKTKRYILLPFVAFAAMFFVPASGHAQSILQSAGNFTLLGGTFINSSGAVGTVISNGNVGLSPNSEAAITGFFPTGPALIVNGTIVATGPVTDQARLDVIQAQTGLAGMAADTNLSNVDLAGKTLVPGVYKFDGSANLTGALVLDGQGRNNVFWVFQVGTSFTSSVGSTVTVINAGTNGGNDYGIFWNCGTSINVGANNQTAGIYLSGTSATFGSTSSGAGRILALAGISLDQNQINAAGGPGASDWSGGLKFDGNGAVVPTSAPVPSPTPSPTLAFQHFGSQHRTTSIGTRSVNGSATGGATAIQWRINGQSWREIAIRPDGRWFLDARVFHPGQSQLRLRARNAAGKTTTVQQITVWRH